MSGVSTAVCESGVLFIYRVKYTVVKDSWVSARDISAENSSSFCLSSAVYRVLSIFIFIYARSSEDHSF